MSVSDPFGARAPLGPGLPDLYRQSPLARTGVGLARFLVDAGAEVTIYDGQPATALADRVAQLEGRLVGPKPIPRSWRNPG